MSRVLISLLRLLPQSLASRLPLLVVAAFILGTILTGWTMYNLNKRNMALARAETSGEVLGDILNNETWRRLPEDRKTSFGLYEVIRQANLRDDLPPDSIPLILTLNGERVRAAVAFNHAPKLPASLRARNEVQPARVRLSELSRGIARQDQVAQLYVFVSPDSVLTISAPTIWQSRRSQTSVVILGVVTIVAGFSLLLPFAFHLAGPFTKLAARGPVADLKDPLTSSEAHQIRDKINRLTERFEVEQATKERNLAAISHDLRTPVTRLRLRADLLTDDKLRDRFESDLDEVSSIIDGALDLLSLRSQPEESFRFSLTSLLESLVSDYADTGCNVTFHASEEIRLQSATSIFTTPEDVRIRTETTCLMQGQPDKLRRAFSNLIDNALKYGGRAVVEVHSFSHDMISVTIRDFGPGIEPDQIQCMRLPFVRGHTAQIERGVGLGLSIAGELIELHGGTLDFTNADPGLLVTVLVPRGI